MSTAELNSYQMALVNDVLAAAKPSTFFVKWPVGAGKGRAALAIVDAVLQRQPSARVLLICDTAAQREHFRDHSQRDGISIEFVDRHWLRAKQADGPAPKDLWHAGAYVAGMSFAVEPDMVASLSSVAWQVVILPEWHRSLNLEAEQLVENLARSSPELRVVVFGDPNVELSGNVGPRPHFESVLRFSDLVASEHVGSAGWRQPRFSLVHLSPSDAERALGEEVKALVSQLRTGQASHRPEASAIARKAQSSQAALDDALRRLRTRLELAPTTERAGAAPLSAETEVCLQRLELLSEDSKLAAVSDLIEEVTTSVGPHASICIFTEFRATALYLQQAVSLQARRVHLLHGGMTHNERSQTLHSYLGKGDVLVATAASVQGFEVRRADAVILFDLPQKRSGVLVVLSRFLGLSRNTPLPVHVLPPDASFGPVEAGEYEVGDLGEIAAKWQ